jgi:hypothetical protein
LGGSRTATDRLRAAPRLPRERRPGLWSLRTRTSEELAELLLLPPHPTTTSARSSVATLPMSANLLTAAKAIDHPSGFP